MNWPAPPLKRYDKKNMNDKNINFHTNLLQNPRLRKSGFWLKFRGNSNGANYAGKLHIFASSYPDWCDIATVIIPYLMNNNITFKTINMNNDGLSIVQDNTSSQFGKAFTIYPVDDAEMEHVARDLDAILLNANLITRGNILNDRAFGHTGRIFYRFDRNPFRLDNHGELEYIPPEYAKQIAPSHPHNPMNLRDPLLQGTVRVQQHALETDKQNRETNTTLKRKTR